MNAPLRSLALGATALVCSSAAAAIDNQAIVGTFKAICFDSQAPLQTAEHMAHANRWKKDERFSGQQKSATQTVTGHAWDIPSADSPLSVAISTIETGSDQKEMCTVLVRRFSAATALENSLVSELQLTSAKRRKVTLEGMSQWDLERPKDGLVWLFSQRLADGPGVQLGIVRDR
jgi:hypothetical protein